MLVVFCMFRNVLLLNVNCLLCVQDVFLLKADCLLCVQECSSVESRLSFVCSGMFLC